MSQIPSTPASRCDPKARDEVPQRVIGNGVQNESALLHGTSRAIAEQRMHARSQVLIATTREFASCHVSPVPSATAPDADVVCARSSVLRRVRLRRDGDRRSDTIAKRAMVADLDRDDVLFIVEYRSSVVEQNLRPARAHGSVLPFHADER